MLFAPSIPATEHLARPNREAGAQQARLLLSEP